jgi:hypothetical protein
MCQCRPDNVRLREAKRVGNLNDEFAHRAEALVASIRRHETFSS